MARRECVEHFVEGRDAWQVGFGGLLTRIRGILGTVVFTVLATTGVPWWWPENTNGTQTVETRWVVAFLVFAVGASIVAVLLRNRKRSLRTLGIQGHLHDLAHFIRDSYADHCRLLQSGQLPSEDQERHYFEGFVKGLCDHAQKFFSLFTQDGTVGVAVRLAVPSSIDSKRVVYRTVARSSQFNAARARTSEPVDSSEGIPGYLAKARNSTGILIYNDLEEASRAGAFKKTTNESMFPRDVESLMVAPLNAWAGQSKRLIGLLYVASRTKQAFSVRHVDAMRFIADTIANAIATTVEQQRVNLNYNSLEEPHGTSKLR